LKNKFQSIDANKFFNNFWITKLTFCISYLSLQVMNDLTNTYPTMKHSTMIMSTFELVTIERDDQ